MSGGFQALFALIQDILSLLTEAAGHSVVMWFLAFVFAWSGVVKLRRPVLAAMAIADFGITRRVYPVLGRLLGAAESLLALTLAIKVFPRLTLSVTALLLWFFTALIARSLWLGKDFACFCFGDSDATLSRWTLARTAALAILATFMTSLPTPDSAQMRLQANVFQALIAVSCLGTIVLGSTMPRLLRWRKESLSNRI